jgi:hypothetical protein
MATQGLASGPISGDEADPDKMYEKRLIAYVKGDNRAAGMDFEPKPEDALTANALHEEAVSKWNKPNVISKKKGGAIKSHASKRADGCCEKGHTKGRVI